MPVSIDVHKMIGFSISHARHLIFHPNQKLEMLADLEVSSRLPIILTVGYSSVCFAVSDGNSH